MTDYRLTYRRIIFFTFLIGLFLSFQGCDRLNEVPAPRETDSPKIAQSGEQLYVEKCAACHDGPVARAPHRIVFSLLGPEHILSSMNEGIMQAQARGLSEEQKTKLAEHLGERPLQKRTESLTLGCEEIPDYKEPIDTGSEIKTWGMSPKNTRSISAEIAGLTAADVPKLELKWAFAYPNAKQARSQPIVSRGEIFLGSHDGTVYALDLETGCKKWTFNADSEVRSALSLGSSKDGKSEVLYFGDIAGSVYAIARADGALIWKTRPNDHPTTTITGSPKLHDGVLYVPLSSREWASAADPAYPCCTFRGGVAALHIADGSRKWVAYVSDKAKPTGKLNAEGVGIMAPSGAPVWNSPAIDTKRNRLYVGTGENYSSPASDTSDAVLAIDLETGELVWSHQSLSGDAWNMACFVGGPAGNCPSENGPDLDIGASTIITTLENGKDILLVGSKAGLVFGLDLDENGKLLWKNKIGAGGFDGGIHWGMALRGSSLFAAVADSDYGFDPNYKGRPGISSLDIMNGEVNWYTEAEDHCPEGSKPICKYGLSAAITSIPGAVFAGSYDGYLMAYGEEDGAVLWEYPTNRPFDTVSGEQGHGGSIESDGPVIIDGTVLINSGYSFGTRLQGNVLLAFSVDGK